MVTNASRRPQRRNVTGPGNVDVNSIAGASRSVGERSLSRRSLGRRRAGRTGSSWI